MFTYFYIIYSVSKRVFLLVLLFFLGRMFSMGLVFGPVAHLWYKVLDKYLPAATLKTVAKKIMADQAVAAPFFCSAFFMGRLSDI